LQHAADHAGHTQERKAAFINPIDRGPQPLQAPVKGQTCKAANHKTGSENPTRPACAQGQRGRQYFSHHGDHDNRQTGLKRPVDHGQDGKIPLAQDNRQIEPDNPDQASPDRSANPHRDLDAV